MLVLHYTGMRSAEAALDRLCDPVSKVSAHVLIDEDGTAVRLVDEAYRAWHAGVSAWRGIEGVNACSLGVELVNPGEEHGLRAFPAVQIEALVALCRDWIARYKIPAVHVVGHSDVAPDRKRDPGPLFPWARLADAGIGLWPGMDAPVLDEASKRALRFIGYRMDRFGVDACLRAFRLRFLPDHPGGPMDAATSRRIAQVAHAYQQGQGV